MCRSCWPELVVSGLPASASKYRDYKCVPSFLASLPSPTPCDMKPAGYQAAPSRESEQTQGWKDLQSTSGQIYTPALPIHYGLWCILPFIDHTDSGISNGMLAYSCFWKTDLETDCSGVSGNLVESQPSLAGCPPVLCSHVTFSP